MGLLVCSGNFLGNLFEVMCVAHVLVLRCFPGDSRVFSFCCGDFYAFSLAKRSSKGMMVLFLLGANPPGCPSWLLPRKK